MKKLKCYLVDDEIDAIENLQELLLQHCDDIEIAGYSSQVKNAASFLSVNQMDVLFLDIRMQNETGFDLLTQLPGFSGSVVFVTAHDEYGLKAIKFSATDYLLKPVDPGELRLAIQKVRQRSIDTDTRQQIAMLLQSVENQRRTAQKKIALSDAEEIRYVEIDQILYCKSDNSYTTFHLSDGRKIMVTKSIAEYESLLSIYGFIRTHQSYLVNKNHISAYKKEDGGYLVMEDHSTVPVSRQRKGVIREIFG